MIVIVMGVSGSGKTTVGARLAAELGWQFLDADDYHSPQNVARMAAGRPLSDADRQPWLARLREVIAGYLTRRQDLVLACSALKESYRRQLTVDATLVRFVYLKGDPGLIRQRLRARVGHYAKADLLASQLATLEEPRDAITVLADDRPDHMVRIIVEALGLPKLQRRPANRPADGSPDLAPAPAPARAPGRPARPRRRRKRPPA